MYVQESPDLKSKRINWILPYDWNFILRKWFWGNLIIDSKEMLSIFVVFGEDVCNISFTLNLFDVYEYFMYSFFNRVLTNCYLSDAFGCS